jgi:hypothetical protein
MFRRGVLVTTKLPCSRCGATILPTTATRTGGLCMPCFSDPEDKRGQQRRLEAERKRLEATPTAELLRQLDGAVHRSIEAAATAAVTDLASERIYGFFLLHYIFQSCRAAVLTEAQRERSIHKEEKWSPVDCGYYFYREDLFDEPNRLLSPLERRGQEEEIARIFVRAMLHVRRNIITDPRAVLSVMDYTEGPGVPFFAFAEVFNDAEALARLRAELYPGADWDYLDLERSRVPKALDGGLAGGA